MTTPAKYDMLLPLLNIINSLKFTIMQKETFDSQEIKAIRPTLAPERKAGSNFLSCEQAPYLQELIIRARRGGYSQEDGCKAWAQMLSNKSNQVDYEDKEQLDLSEALTVLFQNICYYEAKQHYVAFLEFNSRPERYID